MVDVDTLTGQKGELVARTSSDTETENQSLSKVSQPTSFVSGKETSSKTPSSLFDTDLIKSFKAPEFSIFALDSRSRSLAKQDAYDSDRSRSGSRSRSYKRAGENSPKLPKSKKVKRKLTSGKDAKASSPTLAAASAEVMPLFKNESQKSRLNCCIKFDWYDMMWVYI